VDVEPKIVENEDAASGKNDLKEIPNLKPALAGPCKTGKGFGASPKMS